MSGDPNVTFTCQSCGGVIVEGIPHHCSGTPAPMPTTWTCSHCGEGVHPGTFHHCLPLPVVSQACPAAPLDYSAVLARIADALWAIADRMK